MTPRTWTDEELSAFLDGELNSTDTEELARAVEVDVRLAMRLERLGAANQAYVEAVNEIDSKPMSASLEALIAAPPTAKVIPLRTKTFGAALGAFLTEHRALAAGLVVAAGMWGVVGSLNGSQPPKFAPPSPGGVIPASSPLYEALEKGRSSEAVFVADNVSVTPRLTFASSDGGFCRQYDVASHDGVATAIACREGGKWRNAIAVFGKPAPGGDYQTAGAQKAPALETFIDRHIVGGPLTAAEEEAVIGKGWK